MTPRTHPRRFALVGAISLAAAAIAVSAVALPVQAADGNGSPRGTVSVDPGEGLWSDGANGKPIVVKSSLKCDAAKSSYPAGSTVLPMRAFVLAKQGKESPALAKAVEVTAASDFSNFKDDFLAVGVDVSATKADGTVDDTDQNTFPGYAVEEGQSWQLPTGAAITDFSSILQANKSYSLAAVCLYRVSIGNNSSFYFEPDGTGHLQSAWSTVTTGAETGTQLSWKVTPVTQPTNTGNPSPSNSTSTSASPSHTTSPSSTSTSSTSSSSSPSSTETSPQSSTPTGGTGDPLTVDIGKQYTVTAPVSSFAASELINGEIHSTPLTLTETTTATADGAASYSFTVPAELAPGEHTLVLTGAGSAKTFSIPLTVRAAANNQPFQPLTNWVSNNAATPGGMAGLFLILVVLSTAVVLGWRFFIGRPVSRRKH